MKNVEENISSYQKSFSTLILFPHLIIVNYIKVVNITEFVFRKPGCFSAGMNKNIIGGKNIKYKYNNYYK